ncbi:hypothetical protein WA158_007508 [Blastocystis sp. Blastoise]
MESDKQYNNCFDGAGFLYLKLKKIVDNDKWSRFLIETLFSDGIVYYSYTYIQITVYKISMFGKFKYKTISIPLRQCIYLPWMKIPEDKRYTQYKPLTEPTEFTPHFQFLTPKEQCYWTIPFQTIKINLSSTLSLELNALYFSYACADPCDNRPPLIHMAAVYGDSNLLRQSIQITKIERDWVYHGWDPLNICIYKGMKDLYGLIFSMNNMPDHIYKNGERNILHYIAYNGDIHVLQMYVAMNQRNALYKDYINYEDENKETPIYIAIKKRNYSMITSFIYLGASLIQLNKNNDTPLMCCIREGYEDIALKLTCFAKGEESNHKYILNSFNTTGVTALMLASERGQYRCVHTLMKYNVSVTMNDASGETALFYALRSKKNVQKVFLELLGFSKYPYYVWHLFKKYTHYQSLSCYNNPNKKINKALEEEITGYKQDITSSISSYNIENKVIPINKEDNVDIHINGNQVSINQSEDLSIEEDNNNNIDNNIDNNNTIDHNIDNNNTIDHNIDKNNTIDHNNNNNNNNNIDHNNDNNNNNNNNNNNISLSSSTLSDTITSTTNNNPISINTPLKPSESLLTSLKTVSTDNQNISNAIQSDVSQNDHIPVIIPSVSPSSPVSPTNTQLYSPTSQRIYSLESMDEETKKLLCNKVRLPFSSDIYEQLFKCRNIKNETIIDLVYELNNIKLIALVEFIILFFPIRADDIQFEIDDSFTY